MAPTKTKLDTHIQTKKNGIARSLFGKYVNMDMAKFLLFDPEAYYIITPLIILSELLLNLLIINRVPYTEIDWKAYMQECEGVLNGTTNYAMLRGDTGPLVYPAGFVYIYTALYYLTSRGRNIRIAQYVFTIIYLLQMWLVLRIYAKSRKVPPYVMVFSAFTSYRVHSIYVLRLFNDPIAVLFAFAALNLFMEQYWTWGSICFSLGVGIKMNILLFAPALLLFYVTNLGMWSTVLQLAVCGGVQLLLSAPFFFTYPMQYLQGSFDFGRVFEHKWSVNYHFLPNDFFVSRSFHLSLLLIHLLLLFAFAIPSYVFFNSYVNLRVLQKQLQPQLNHHNQELRKKSSKNANRNKYELFDKLTNEQMNFVKNFEKSLQKSTRHKTLVARDTPKNNCKEDYVSINFDKCTQLFLLPFLISNFIGVICARSLHYQFYVWYYHSLPYLVYSTHFGFWTRFLILGLLEICWNTYPSTNLSSAILHICHLVLLIGMANYIFSMMKKFNKTRELMYPLRNEKIE